MNEIEALRLAYASAESLIANVTPGDLGKPTPCSEWDVRGLLDHYINGLRAFPAWLRGENFDMKQRAFDDDPLAAARAAMEENLEAWRAPGALDTPTKGMPGLRLVDLQLCDAVAHPWDLANATRQDAALPHEVVQMVFDIWRKAPLDVSRTMGAFGPEVPVPHDAPTIDRFVGLLGRNP
jgi:uncharacterized protein (TIGR03086 family)